MKNRWGRSLAAAFVVLVIGVADAKAQLGPELTGRLEKASAVLHEVMSIRDKEIPRDLLDRAYGVAVFPGVVKGAFFFGGRLGNGVISARKEPGGGWSAPAFFTIGGGSFGLQIGAQVTDLILLIMSPGGIDSLLRSKVTLGGDLSVAAGPIGRRGEAALDVRLQAEVLSYSATKGLFAGISLEGATIFSDEDANHELYGRGFTAREILLSGRVSVPEAAKTFLTTLTTYASPKKP